MPDNQVEGEAPKAEPTKPEVPGSETSTSKPEVEAPQTENSKTEGRSEPELTGKTDPKLPLKKGEGNWGLWIGLAILIIIACIGGYWGYVKFIASQAKSEREDKK